MAIAFDVSTDPGFTNPGTSDTFAHTCTGSDLALLVGVFVVSSGSTDRLTGITYNGVSMTRADYVFLNASSHVYLYYLLNPASGTNNVVVSLSASRYFYPLAMSFTGVSASGNPEVVNKNSGVAVTSLTQATTTTADNAWIVGYAVSESGGLNPDANTNQILRDNQQQGRLYRDNNAPKTPAGSVTLGFTQGAGTNNVAMIQMSLAPAGGGGGGPTFTPKVTFI